jgi:hypothetical protein
MLTLSFAQERMASWFAGADQAVAHALGAP